MTSQAGSTSQTGPDRLRKRLDSVEKVSDDPSTDLMVATMKRDGRARGLRNTVPATDQIWAVT